MNVKSVYVSFLPHHFLPHVLSGKESPNSGKFKWILSDLLSTVYMMWCYGVLILSVFYFGVVEAATEFPEGFRRCRRHDPDMDKCVLEAAHIGYHTIKNGVPNLNLPPVQHFPAPPMRFVLGNEAIGFSFVLELSDGLVNHTLEKYNKARVDFNKEIFILDGQLKNMTWYGRYNMLGQFFVGRVKGQGQFTAILHDVTFFSNSKLSKHVRDGKVYWQVDETRISNHPKKVTLNAENIVANKALNDAINKVINDNWEAVLSPHFHKIDITMGKVLQDYINHFLHKVPDEDLFL